VKGKFSIIVFLFLHFNLFAGEDVKIISSTSSSITIEYSPNYLDTSKTTFDNSTFTTISFKHAVGISESSIGKLNIPFRNLAVGVPSEFGNTLQVIRTEHSFIDGKIAPVVGYKKLSSDEIKKAFDEYSKPELVSFGDFGYSREMGIQQIHIYPVQYDTDTEQIKLFKKIVFRINFSASVTNNTEIKDEHLKYSVLNYKVAKKWGRKINRLNKVAKNSVLAEGTWNRFEAPIEGIYKITQSELGALGIDASTVDPRTIRIYNNGGKNLPEKVSAEAPTDLVENSILIIGEEDGSFDSNDYILFYGRGNDFWEFDSGDSDIIRKHHSYSKHNYYWITSSGNAGKRMAGKNSPGNAAQYIQTTTRAFKFLDDDKINIGKSGRDYWGDDFSLASDSRTYVNTLNGRISSEPVKYKFRLANTSSKLFPLTVDENGSVIYSKTMYGYGGSDYRWGSAHNGTAEYNGELLNDRSVLKFKITASANDSKAYIDFYEIEFLKELRAFDDEILFFADDINSVVEFKLSNFSMSDISVYDVTDFENVRRINNPSISGGELSFKSNEEIEGRSKYIALTPPKYRSIQDVEQVGNSNIHGIEEGAEYIIITDKLFKDEAERLADYRQNISLSPQSTIVIYMDEILNEFSDGMMDPTAIRNFLKYAYENWNNKPFYVLFFGDGTYDYFDVEGYNKNFIPTYQTKESLNELASFPTDDYYSRIVGDDQSADLSMGRLNINSVSDAEIIVDKIIAYETQLDNGMWKNLITLVADDGLTSEGDDHETHTKQSESLSKDFIPTYMDRNKLYLAAYPTIITGFGRRKPDVNEGIIEAVNQGTVILNFIGHGNPEVWTHEVVYDKSSTIPRFKNDKYFFLVAATCDFGKYDDPSTQSANEEMLLLEDRGMIGSFSSARLVYAHLNEAISKEFYSHLLNDSVQVSANRTIGEAYYLTKARRSQDNDEKFHLFCDPVLKLNIPQIPAAIDQVNEKDLEVDVQISALGKVSVNGSVRNYNGSVNTGYNGEAIITVYDSEKTKDLPDINYQMVEQGGVIFRGRVTIDNGKFATDFTVPKDISYENRNGKIVSYISDDETDGIGFTNKIIIGGTDSSAVDDGEGPEIEIYFDDESFKNAYLVNEDFTLIVNVADETGLNTTGTGIGHKLEGIIDEQDEKAIDFTNYFVGDLDAGGKSGKVNYKVTDTELGEHKLEVKAWDVFNNASKEITYFSVVNSNELVLADIVNYPNPFSDNTAFTFQHNVSEPIDVKIKIYTVAGRMIKEIDEQNILDKFVKINWDGRDQDGSSIANGTYLYKVIVKSIDGEFNQSVLGKLAVFH